MISINGDTVIMSDAPPMTPPIMSQVHPPWRVPCWKFEKLQIMLLGFGYLESSEKSEKKIHKYYTYRAIIAEIYKIQWQVLMEIQSSHWMPPHDTPHHVTSASTMAGAMLEIWCPPKPPNCKSCCLGLGT